MNFSGLFHQSLPVLTMIFVIELGSLHLLSQRLTQSLYQLFFRIFRSKTVSMTILIILLFPGTVVHELAHLFTAEILGVRTGKLTLVPESLEENEIKAGGVMITQTDPLRRTLIGLAPVIWGIVILATLSYWLPTLWQQTIYAMSQGNMFSGFSLYGLLITCYALFAVSNSMFSSSEDMKGVIPFTATVGIFAAAGYIAGLRIDLTGQLLTGLNLVTTTLVQSLGIVLGVNLIVLAATSLFLSILSPRMKSS